MPASPARGFNGGVEGQQIRLVGHVLDQTQHVADVVGLPVKGGHALGHLGGLFVHLVDAGDGAAHHIVAFLGFLLGLLGLFAAEVGTLGGKLHGRGHGLHALRGLRGFLLLIAGGLARAFQLLEQLFKGLRLRRGNILRLVGGEVDAVVELGDAVPLFVHFRQVAVQRERADQLAVQIAQRREIHHHVLHFAAGIGTRRRITVNGMQVFQHTAEQRRMIRLVVEELADGHAQKIFGLAFPAPQVEHHLVDERQPSLGIAGGKGHGHAVHDTFRNAELFLDDARRGIEGLGQAADFVLAVDIHPVVNAAAHAIRGFGKQRQRTADIADEQHRQQQTHDNGRHGNDDGDAPDSADNTGEVLNDVVPGGIADDAGFGKELLGAEYRGQRGREQYFARLLKIIALYLRNNIGRALMQLVVNAFNLAEQRRKRGNFLLQFLALGTVEPFAESAFRRFRRDGQGLFPVFQQITLHAYGPMQMTDFRSQQGARLGRLTEQVGILLDPAQKIQQQAHGCQKGSNTGTENHVKLFLDGDVDPTH